MLAAFSLVSKAFTEGTAIPKIYSGQGKDHNPPLSWSGMPADTKSLALIVDDPDAPVGNFHSKNKIVLILMISFFPLEKNKKVIEYSFCFV